MRVLKGPLFKRSKDVPKFQRRYFVMEHDEIVGAAMVYSVGDKGEGKEDAPVVATKEKQKFGAKERPVIQKIKKLKKEKPWWEKVREVDKDPIDKKIPLASVLSLSIVSELRYEFRLDSTVRQKPFIFRAETKADFTKWVVGLQTLID